MVYANMALARGALEFASMLAEAGASGAIIPDLPSGEADELGDALVEAGIAPVPLVAPTTPAVGVKQGPEASALPVFLRCIRNTDPGSNAGLPGLTIPAGLGPMTQMPIGLSLYGPSGGEERLLALGLTIEKVLGRVPPPYR